MIRLCHSWAQCTFKITIMIKGINETQESSERTANTPHTQTSTCLPLFSTVFSSLQQLTLELINAGHHHLCLWLVPLAIYCKQTINKCWCLPPLVYLWHSWYSVFRGMQPRSLFLIRSSFQSSSIISISISAFNNHFGYHCLFIPYCITYAYNRL